MDVRGCVWVGESFLSHDKWQIKLLSNIFYNKPWQVKNKIIEWFFYNSYFNFTNDSNSGNNNSQGFENWRTDMGGCV